MTKQPTDSDNRLRLRAEEKFKTNEGAIPEKLSLDEKRLFHELQVHQIELEMQNEELLLKKYDLEAICSRSFYLYELAPFAYIHLTDGLIDDNNSMAVQMLGVGSNDLRNTPLTKYIFCDDQDKYLKHRLKFFKPHENLGLEIRMVRTDGLLLWVLLQLMPTDAGDCWVTLLNITDRKRIEEVLNVNEELHRNILKSAMDGFWIVDTDGRILEVNMAYCVMSGYTEQELLSMRVTDVEDKETAEVTSAHIQKVMAHGQDRFKSRHRRKDGTLFDVEVSSQYQSHGSGIFVAFLRDITESNAAALS
jgi:PAS domain S-box-containing protein